MESREESDLSDDEVFFGKLSLKEVKKRILMGIYQKNKLASDRKNVEDFKLIETKSQPNIVSPCMEDNRTVENLKSMSDPIFNRNKEFTQQEFIPASENRDSFLEIEKIVIEQCESPNESKSNNLDNTLEVIDFILNHAQSHDKENGDTNLIKHEEGINKDNNHYKCGVKVQKDEILPLSSSYNEVEPQQECIANNILSTTLASTPIKCEQTESKTFLKSKNIKHGVNSAINTPICNKKILPNIFKTPKLSQTKSSRPKAYEYIASPVATYIKNSPQVPLLKHVHPKKPLSSSSLIPKPLKNALECKTGDKENVVLPQLAYRSAKKTTVIDVNKEKLPQSNWAQKLPTSLQKPVVLKHNHRETGKKPLVSQQDSFADLSLHQADVSFCTQKLAFNKL